LHNNISKRDTCIGPSEQRHLYMLTASFDCKLSQACPHLQRLGVGKALGCASHSQQHRQPLQHPAQLALQDITSAHVQHKTWLGAVC
jgi:hypothetical protein